MEEKMYIDGHPLEKKELALAREGKMEESLETKMEFLRKLKESGIDHCPCQEACIHHGNCYECVVLHRGHRDHLPVCFFDMVNERMQALSGLTEGTFRAEQPK